MPNEYTARVTKIVRVTTNLRRVFHDLVDTALPISALLIVTNINGALAEARDSSHLCDIAAHKASEIKGVPVNVLKAITRTETDRPAEVGLKPWPWTVNMEGQGKWFSTEDEARSYVFKHFKRGARSFDVGCFQINYKWHGEAFRSIDDMFDPEKNAIYAAGFLRDLYDELGDWSVAAGAYHSRTPRFAESYTARFENILNSIASESEFASLELQPERHDPNTPIFLSSRNRTPLIGSGSTRLGSLVPTVRISEQNEQAFVVVN